MRGRSRHAATSLATLVLLGSCSSGTEPWIAYHPSVGALAGRYAMKKPITLANGVTILGDTFVLGADASLQRRRNLVGPGPIGAYGSTDLGIYSVDGPRVVLTFSCYGGACYGSLTLNAMPMGTDRRIARLVLTDDGRTTYFERTQ